MEYSKMDDESSELYHPDDLLVRDALLGSIERRWDKSDQDVFIAAVILNPFVKASNFLCFIHVFNHLHFFRPHHFGPRQKCLL